MHPLHFKPDAEPARPALVAALNLGGFASLCERPDAGTLLNRYLSHYFQVLDLAFVDAWRDHFRPPGSLVQVRPPDFMKFTGDGALLLWFRTAEQELQGDFTHAVIQALRHFQQTLPGQVALWEEKWDAPGLPRSVRIGLTSGPVHPLRTGALRIFAESVDYAGQAINRAVWLQNHCPAVGFLMDAALAPAGAEWCALSAREMRGGRATSVAAFRVDYERAHAADPAVLTALPAGA